MWKIENIVKMDAMVEFGKIGKIFKIWLDGSIMWVILIM